MKRFNKIYLEISNICNLACAFCPGTKREMRALSRREFELLLKKTAPYTDYLYFHLMGEPLCHPQLGDFLDMAGDAGMKVIITTNGTLLCDMREVLLSSKALHKVNVSLHAFEANDLSVPFDEYLDGCFEFGRAAAGRKLVVYRLWNHGGADAKNELVLASMERYFPKPWADDWRGARIADRIYLDYGDKFDWPDMTAADLGGDVSCYGLRDQIGVLADGTVVPCCLDHDGDIALGNLFESSMEEILSSARAQNIVGAFAKGRACEPLCRRCGYAHAKFK